MKENHARGQQLQRHPHLARVARADPRLVEGRGHQARDHQLPHPPPREGRPVRRAHLRPLAGLGVLLRQVQAHPLQGHHLRQVRRRGHARQGASRADGPHPAGQPRQPHLVLQGHAQPPRHPARHQPAQPRARPLLRPVHRHLGRRGRARAAAPAARRGGRGPWRPRRQGAGRDGGQPPLRAQPAHRRAERGAGRVQARPRGGAHATHRRAGRGAAGDRGPDQGAGHGSGDEPIVFEPTGEVIVAAGEKAGKAASRAQQGRRGRDRARQHGDPGAREAPGGPGQGPGRGPAPAARRHARGRARAPPARPRAPRTRSARPATRSTASSRA